MSLTFDSINTLIGFYVWFSSINSLFFFFPFLWFQFPQEWKQSQVQVVAKFRWQNLYKTLTTQITFHFVRMTHKLQTEQNQNTSFPRKEHQTSLARENLITCVLLLDYQLVLTVMLDYENQENTFLHSFRTTEVT